MVVPMNPLASSLHVEYLLTPTTQARLSAWDAQIAAEPPLQPIRWHVFLERYLRSATVTASTRIEGNPMSLDQVDALLRGDAVDAPRIAQRENLNYNQALDTATTFALTPSFEWTEATIRVINHQLLRDLPEDRQGRYREEAVTVGPYLAPDHNIVPNLMAELVSWLRSARETHPLVRVALLHLNLVAIHPFVDGNGRTARIVSSLELMRSGVGATELISIEPYLAEQRGEYFSQLSATIGPTYAPDRHPATPWLDYLIGIYVDRLGFEARMREAWPYDLGTVADALANASHPPQWAALIALTGIYPLRTRSVADAIGRAMPTARALLNAMTRAGWLEMRGRTRGAAYYPGARTRRLALRSPEIVRRYVHGLTLGLEIPRSENGQ